MDRFTPYEGKKPYVFISYARKDSGIMLDTMNILKNMNYRLWYDEGIPGGNDWPLYISEHLRKSSVVVFFLSAKSMVSPNCYSEIISASEQEKPVICIAVDECARIICTAAKEKRAVTDTEKSFIAAITEQYSAQRRNSARIPLTGEWAKPLEKAFFVDDCPDTAEALADRILSFNVITDTFKGIYDDNAAKKGGFNRWMIASAACLCVIAALSVTGWNIYSSRASDAISKETPSQAVETPHPTVDPQSIPGLSTAISFPDSQQERAIRNAVGIKEGEIDDVCLREITQLHFCGKTVQNSSGNAKYENGNWYIGQAKAVQGEIKDFSLIKKMYYLESLSLVYQDISSISELSKLQILTSLDVSGNPIKTLDMSDGFRTLEILNISHTQISSLCDIHPPATLKTIYVSADMLPMQLDKNASYEVVLVK